MKVKELFERGGIDVAVEYELEYTTPEGDVDYKTLEITGEVLTTTDMYGTGDSPTDYEFVPSEAVDKETGERVSLKVIPRDDWRWINTQAIEKVNRYR